jgi:hypothetical protein
VTHGTPGRERLVAQAPQEQRDEPVVARLTRVGEDAQRVGPHVARVGGRGAKLTPPARPGGYGGR